MIPDISEHYTKEDRHCTIAAHCPHDPTCLEPCEEANESYDQAMWEMEN